MKKVLLATTALIGALSISSAAMAQEPLSVTVGGYVDVAGAHVGQSQDGGSRSSDLRTSSEVHIRAEGTTDNGLTYGAFVQLEGDNGVDTNPAAGANSNNGDEVFGYLSGSWGRVNAGDSESATDTDGLTITAPNGFGLGGVAADEESYRDFINDATGSATREGIYALGSLYEPFNSGKATKITYYTPIWNGFQAGASYASDGASGFSTNRSDTNAAAFFPTTASFENFFEYAAAWNGSYNDVGLGFSGTYSKASSKTTGAAVTEIEDASVYSLGAKVTYAGFTVAGNYVDAGDSGTDLVARRYDDTNAFSAGVQYEFGPYVIGANALWSKLEAAGTNADDMSYDAYSIGGSWAVAPGFVAYAEGTAFDFDGTPGTTANNSEGHVVVLGTRVSF